MPRGRPGPQLRTEGPTSTFRWSPNARVLLLAGSSYGGNAVDLHSCTLVEDLSDTDSNSTVGVAAVQCNHKHASRPRVDPHWCRRCTIRCGHRWRTRLYACSSSGFVGSSGRSHCASQPTGDGAHRYLCGVWGPERQRFAPTCCRRSHSPQRCAGGTVQQGVVPLAAAVRCYSLRSMGTWTYSS
jgi:hypothetical protein